jgi:hypothetical protein
MTRFNPRASIAQKDHQSVAVDLYRDRDWWKLRFLCDVIGSAVQAETAFVGALTSRAKRSTVSDRATSKFVAYAS